MNGIGGRTIAEAMENLSLSEYRLWLKYRRRYGGLNPIVRTEWGAALVASVIANVNRGKNTPPFKLADFAPHIKTAPISLEEAMHTWA
ncbi:phage tail assembly protein T [Entomohabitans teleogrylli]|uniref:phage tail assembly protein T n=1 Tax=Entomohabitans teleogrylli TaxID=1384589 RepID=UPI00073D577E